MVPHSRWAAETLEIASGVARQITNMRVHIYFDNGRADWRNRFFWWLRRPVLGNEVRNGDERNGRSGNSADDDKNVCH